MGATEEGPRSIKTRVWFVSIKNGNKSDEQDRSYQICNDFKLKRKGDFNENKNI